MLCGTAKARIRPTSISTSLHDALTTDADAPHNMNQMRNGMVAANPSWVAMPNADQQSQRRSTTVA